MQRLKQAMKILIPVILLSYLFHRLDVQRIWSLAKSADVLLFAVTFMTLCLRNALGAYRSNVLLGYRGLHYGTWTLTRYYFIGNFFNLFLPEVIGRDLARGYYLYRSSDGKQESISAIVMERFIGIVALMVMSLGAVLAAMLLNLTAVSNDMVRLVTLVFSAGCVAIVLFFYERTDRFLESLLPRTARKTVHRAVGFIRDIISFKQSPRILLHVFAVSLVFQFIGVVATVLLARSLGDTTPVIYFIILLPVIWMIGMLPVSINGLGIREGSFVVLFGAIGMSGEMALTISLLWFVQNVALGLVGGVLLLFNNDHMEKTSG